MKLAAVLLAFGVSTCEQPPNVQAPAEIGRWQVVPAASQPVTTGGTPFPMAWRIDTVSGAMEICTYDPGGYPLTKTILAPEAVTCKAAPAPSVP